MDYCKNICIYNIFYVVHRFVLIQREIVEKVVSFYETTRNQAINTQYKDLVIRVKDQSKVGYRKISRHINGLVGCSCQRWFIEMMNIKMSNKIIEFLSTYIISDSPLHQYHIFSKWKRKQIPYQSSNVGILFLEYWMKYYGSKKSSNVSYKYICTAQDVMKSLVRLINTGSTYKCIYKKILTIQHIGVEEHPFFHEYLLRILLCSRLVSRSARCKFWKNKLIHPKSWLYNEMSKQISQFTESDSYMSLRVICSLTQLDIFQAEHLMFLYYSNRRNLQMYDYIFLNQNIYYMKRQNKSQCIISRI